jgi:MFS superfamily sulfate permease-like transporter
MNTKNSYFQDSVNAIVVFLVALPVSLGVAVASGVDPIYGVLSAIVGAFVVSVLTGSPLQVSGPSTGLAVMVLHVVQTYGAAALIPLAIITGIFQIIIASLKWGHLFQATPPSLVKAMLSGIGFLILISQFFILLGGQMQSDSYMNIINLPDLIMNNVVYNMTPVIKHQIIICLIVIFSLAGWSKVKNKKLKVLPASLVAIIVASAVTYFMGWNVSKIQLPHDISSIFDGLNYAASFAVLDFKFVLYAIGFAFVASVETMLCVSAVDKMTGTYSKYNKTILAQGIGNLVAGVVGAIPVVGVISRTAPNIEVGSKTRVSAIVQGGFMVLALLLPSVLEYIPIAALVGLLIFVGFKLLDITHILDYAKNYNKTSLIFATTFILTITVDLLAGVLAGFFVASFILLFDVLKFDLKVEEDHGNKLIKFTGKLSFLDLPVINKELQEHSNNVPTNLEVCLKEVQYLDNAIKERFDDWKKSLEEQGHTVNIKEE